MLMVAREPRLYLDGNAASNFRSIAVALAISWRSPKHGTLAIDSHGAGVGEGVLEQVDGTKAKEDHRG
jgi:microcompartment protein CcmK/EutM